MMSPRRERVVAPGTPAAPVAVRVMSPTRQNFASSATLTGTRVSYSALGASRVVDMQAPQNAAMYRSNSTNLKHAASAELSPVMVATVEDAAGIRTPRWPPEIATTRAESPCVTQVPWPVSSCASRPVLTARSSLQSFAPSRRCAASPQPVQTRRTLSPQPNPYRYLGSAENLGTASPAPSPHIATQPARTTQDSTASISGHPASVVLHVSSPRAASPSPPAPRSTPASMSQPFTSFVGPSPRNPLPPPSLPLTPRQLVTPNMPQQVSAERVGQAPVRRPQDVPQHHVHQQQQPHHPQQFLSHEQQQYQQLRTELQHQRKVLEDIRRTQAELNARQDVSTAGISAAQDTTERIKTSASAWHHGLKERKPLTPRRDSAQPKPVTPRRDNVQLRPLTSRMEGVQTQPLTPRKDVQLFEAATRGAGNFDGCQASAAKGTADNLVLVAESMANAMGAMLTELDVALSQTKADLSQRGLESNEIVQHPEYQRLVQVREKVIAQVSKLAHNEHQRNRTYSMSSASTLTEPPPSTHALPGCGAVSDNGSPTRKRQDSECSTSTLAASSQFASDAITPLSGVGGGGFGFDSFSIGALATPRFSSTNESTPIIVMPVHKDPIVGPFSQDGCGGNLSLSEDGYTATRRNGCRNAVAIGSTPLKRQAGGLYYEVRLKKQLKGWLGGLAVGITHTAPASLRRVPDLAWRVPDSFLVGYTGRLYLNETETAAEWRPDTLEAGQTVGVLITGDGLADFVIFVDGAETYRLQGRKLISGGLRDEPLYPIVDVFNATVELSLVKQATAPSIPAMKSGFVAPTSLRDTGPSLAASAIGALTPR